MAQSTINLQLTREEAIALTKNLPSEFEGGYETVEFYRSSEDIMLAELRKQLCEILGISWDI